MAKENATDTEVKNGKAITLQSIYDGYAGKATDLTPFEVDIVARHSVVFTEDFLTIKKGHKQNVSTVMKDWYDANGVIKVLDTDKNKVEQKSTLVE